MADRDSGDFPGHCIAALSVSKDRDDAVEINFYHDGIIRLKRIGALPEWFPESHTFVFLKADSLACPECEGRELN